MMGMPFTIWGLPHQDLPVARFVARRRVRGNTLACRFVWVRVREPVTDKQLETIQATSSRASSFRRSRQHAFDALHLVFAPPGIGELAVFLNRQLEQLGPPLRSVPFELV